MPGMSGRQLVDRCRQVRQDFKVLYMSGYTDKTIVRHGVLEKEVNLILFRNPSHSMGWQGR